MRLQRPLRRGVVMGLLAAAGAVAVTLSWMAPEPPAGPEPAVPISNVACASTYSAPPNYGTRSLGNECVR